MIRLTVDEILMECALAWSKRSTCLRVHAGAVVAVNDHIVSTGYNGNAPGKIHCADYFKNLFEARMPTSEHLLYQTDWGAYLLSDHFSQEHHEWAIEHELHAEANAIIYAARRGISVNSGTIYTTHSPCLACTKAIIHAGIKRVVYHVLYDREEGLKSLEILKDNNIEISNV